MAASPWNVRSEDVILGAGLAAHDVDERLDIGAAGLPAFQDVVSDGSGHRAPGAR
jgi:hypothetical protein